LDRTLADFFTFVDQTIGLNRTLIVLSADHGVDESPEYYHRLFSRGPTEPPAKLPPGNNPPNPPDAGRHVSDELVANANAQLRARLKIDVDLVKAFWPPSFYLDRAKAKELKLDP